MFSKTLIPFVIFLLPFLLSAQTSHHGFSLRVGVAANPTMDFVQTPGAFSPARSNNKPAFGASLRYDYHFNDRFSSFMGGGIAFMTNAVLLPQFSDGPNSFLSGFPGTRFSNSVSFGELGIAYAQPLGYRFALVSEVGGQLLKVDWGGGSGSRGSFDQETNETFSSIEYSYWHNPKEQLNLALQLSPGIRYQLGDHFYLTLRGNFVFSKALLLENGTFEAFNLDAPQLATGAFEQRYGMKGIDLMGSYRF